MESSKDSNPSLSAAVAAGSRWLASTSINPLCRDEWARELAGPEGRCLAKLLDQMSPQNRILIGQRAAYMDRLVSYHLLESKNRQIVLLGAGFDSKAARFATASSLFFEVDRAATQAEKMARIRGLDNYPVESACYVECDLERDDLFSALSNAGFDENEPTLFLMEGLACYLTEGAVKNTLRSIANSSDPRSQLVFDYLPPQSCSAHEDDEQSPIAARVFDQEPIQWLCEEPSSLLLDQGFSSVELMTFEQLCHSMGDSGFEHKTNCYSVAHATRSEPDTVWPLAITNPPTKTR